jgi:hypothetical protein
LSISEVMTGWDVLERQIPAMNNLNLLVSDFSNDVDQNTQVIWWSNDCEFETVQVVNDDGTVTEEIKHPKSNEWLQTFTTKRWQDTESSATYC